MQSDSNADHADIGKIGFPGVIIILFNWINVRKRGKWDVWPEGCAPAATKSALGPPSCSRVLFKKTMDSIAVIWHYSLLVLLIRSIYRFHWMFLGR